jgi:hypothetical protein
MVHCGQAATSVTVRDAFAIKEARHIGPIDIPDIVAKLYKSPPIQLGKIQVC